MPVNYELKLIIIQKHQKIIYIYRTLNALNRIIMTTMLEHFGIYLNNETQLNQIERDFFINNFERIKLNKKSYLIEAGKIENYLYFIEKGILRYWTQDSEDKEVTFWYSFSGEFANSYYSLKQNTLSEFNIQALTDSVVWRVEKECLFDIYSKSLTLNIIAREIMEDIFTRKILREISLLKLTPEDRYKELLSKEPELIKTIPLKHLASYIGVTPQALSRIRKRIY